jgi:hypothetical protein
VQQGPQYPYQQYQPPQQYPGFPPPKPGGGKTALIVVLVVAGVLVLAGVSVGAFFLLRSGDDKRSTAAPSTSASPAGEPDKYSSLPRCPEVAGRMQGLPPLVRDDPPQPGSTSDDELTMIQLSCSWMKSGSSSGQVTMYLSKSNVPGSGAGTRYAAAGYDNAVEDGGKPITAGIGKATKAADVDFHASSSLQCGVHFYQGNVDVIVIVQAADEQDRNVERCRRNAHKLAESASQSLN